MTRSILVGKQDPPSERSAATDVEISVVVPFFNEENAIVEFCDRLLRVLGEFGRPFEMIAVDDGSKDGTWLELEKAHASSPMIKLVRLTANFGQTAALAAGIHHASGRIIVPMDGDLQHLPEDIPRFIAKLEEGYDVVSGWRQKRRDNALTRAVPSRIANWLMQKLSGVQIHDFGTTFKAYRAEVLRELVLYGDFHRFIPALAAARGAAVTELPIENVLRRGGGSNYGLARTFTVFFDLLRIAFLLHFIAQPLKMFGSLGLLFTAGGGGVLTWLVFEKYVYGLAILGQRGPLFLASLFAMLLGFQLFTLGFLAEMNARIYHEIRPGSIYSVRCRKGDFGSLYAHAAS